jgi:hypothetical protein
MGFIQITIGRLKIFGMQLMIKIVIRIVLMLQKLLVRNQVILKAPVGNKTLHIVDQLMKNMKR